MSRTDGLDTGALVTLTNTGTGATTLFHLLWVPPGDTTAVASLTATVDPEVWTFTPTVGVYGTYLVEMIEDESLPSQLVERRVIAVRTPNRGLVIPALNEIGDPNASLILAGSPQNEAAYNNAVDFADSALNAVPYAAWWRAFHEVISSLDDPDAILTAVAPTDVTKAAAAVGVSTKAARADHKHDVATGVPVNVTKAAAAEGVATSLSRSDHKHDVSTAVAGAALVGDASAEGVLTTLSRSDHKHGISAGVPVDVTKAAAAEGVASTFSRSDHKHDVSTAVPVTTGFALSEGTSSSLARADHVHTLGAATGAADGYLSRSSIPNGTIWTVAADVPDGNLFEFLCTGAGGGAAGGNVTFNVGTFDVTGGRGGGGGARPPPYVWSRAYVISQLPITFTVPSSGGTSGSAASRTTTGSTNGGNGGNGGSAFVTGVSGKIAFAGGGGGATASAGGGGGGAWTSGAASAPGGPTDGSSASNAIVYGLGGAAGQARNLAPTGTQTFARHGGGGGGGAASTKAIVGSTGGISQFGGGGGGCGGGAGMTASVAVGPTQGTNGGGHDFTLFLTSPFGGGGGTAVTNSNGNPGANGDHTVAGYGGAGGAGASAASGSTTAFDGGNGGFPGGGGGGGGGACSSSGTVVSGAGGTGAAAEIVVTAYL